jgi:hypothetical protein
MYSSATTTLVAEIGTKKKGCMEYFTTIKSKGKPKNGLEWHTFLKLILKIRTCQKEGSLLKPLCRQTKSGGML